MDLARAVRTRLTFGPVANQFPVWSPDGKWIAYVTQRNGKFVLLRKASDGSGADEELLVDEQQMLTSDWSRNGKYLIYSRTSLKGLISSQPSISEVWAVPLEGERKPFQVSASGADAHLSPDGHWVAYISRESGETNVYVIPFGGGEGKWQISANGGVGAGWNRDGKTLYYVDPSFNLFAVPVKSAGSSLQFGAAEMIAPNTLSAPNVFYQVSPDDKKILTMQVSQQVGQSVTVVTDFRA